MERYNSNLLFRIRNRLRCSIHAALRKASKGGSAVRNLGCSIDEFKSYIEQQFQDGMTWDNWGLGPGKWHMDHVIPLSSFDLSDPDNFSKACHFTNIRPMWGMDNIRKGPRLDLHAAIMHYKRQIEYLQNKVAELQSISPASDTGIAQSEPCSVETPTT